MRVAEVSDAHELTSPDTPVFGNFLRHPKIQFSSVVHRHDFSMPRFKGNSAI